MLADLDRPIETFEYKPWGREIGLRALAASQFVEVMRLVSAIPDDDRDAQLRAFSFICSIGIVEPACKPEEWADEVRLDTLIELGNRILAKTNETHTEAAKKN